MALKCTICGADNFKNKKVKVKKLLNFGNAVVSLIISSTKAAIEAKPKHSINLAISPEQKFKKFAQKNFSNIISGYSGRSIPRSRYHILFNVVG